MYVTHNHHWKIENAVVNADEARVENCHHDFSDEIEKDILDERRINETFNGCESLDDLWTEGRQEWIHDYADPTPTVTEANHPLVKNYCR